MHVVHQTESLLTASVSIVWDQALVVKKTLIVLQKVPFPLLCRSKDELKATLTVRWREYTKVLRHSLSILIRVPLNMLRQATLPLLARLLNSAESLL